MPKATKKQTVQVDVSGVKTRTHWTVKPYTRVEELKTAFKRNGKGRTPRHERMHEKED